jgi:predicted nucleic acid-binding protein
MTGSEKVFFDTSPLIYLIEDNSKYALQVRDFMAKHLLLWESQFFTSSITLAEFYVKPKATGNTNLINVFKAKLYEFHFVIFDITPNIAELSAELRSKYTRLKAFDSIQLATAIAFGCTLFFTNDAELKLIEEVKILTVDELIK